MGLADVVVEGDVGGRVGLTVHALEDAVEGQVHGVEVVAGAKGGDRVGNGGGFVGGCEAGAVVCA